MAFNHENLNVYQRSTMMQSTKLATKLATKKEAPHKPGSVEW
jgi:hypothetical protein